MELFEIYLIMTNNNWTQFNDDNAALIKIDNILNTKHSVPKETLTAKFLCIFYNVHQTQIVL